MDKNIPLMILLFLLANVAVHANEVELSSFETDYCTNYPEGTLSKPNLWKHCCLLHDMFFWAGGDKDARDKSDLELKSCIEKTGARRQASIMYYAVRAGSYSPVKYPKRKWNNGWVTRRDFQVLTPQDIMLIQIELASGYDYVSDELKTYFINQLISRLE